MNVFSSFLLAFSLSLPLWALAADAPPPDNRADERFKSMDTGAKGFLTFEDFQKRFPNMQRPAFDAIDADRDGTISLEEWRAFFHGHGMDGRTPPPGHGDTPLIRPPAKE
jgi:Ca2+-binding EF-hand superfamily protein